MYKGLENWQAAFYGKVDDKNLTDKSDMVFTTLSEITGVFDGPDSAGPAMYMLTNKKALYGAAYIFDSEVVNGIYNKIGAFYAFPSSIHEVIVYAYKKREKSTDEYMVNMVKEVNDTTVDERDQLSFEVLYFDGNEFESVGGT